MSELRSACDVADAEPRRQVERGYGLLRQGRAAEAVRLGEQLLATRADDPQVLLLAAEARFAAGDAEGAVDAIDRAIGIAPGAMLLSRKAQFLLALRRRTDARRAAAEAAALAGGDGRALWSAGKLHAGCNDPTAACALYEQALAAGCGIPELLYDLATARFFTGDFAGAEESIEALPADSPVIGHALYLRATLRRQTEACNHVDDLQARLQAGLPDAPRRAACLYALAKELEDLGRTDRAFAVLGEAAALKRRTLRYDAAAERAAIDGIREAYTRRAMQTDVPGHDEEGAIFIVGMPRTGTTLMERMLGRHEEVASAGELPDFGQVLAAAARARRAERAGSTMVEASLQLDFAALGRDYMRGAREAAPGRRMFIDKMPINYMYCGLIRKALPKARIVHLVRDPMDSCYAVYKTLFNQAYHFSYDLEELGAYYIAYHRLMRHWHAVMPGAILDVRYEDLVTDTDAQVRRLLAWCGLEWQPTVLSPAENDTPSTTASAAQVREPIYTSSIGKWRRNEAGLQPLLDMLKKVDIVS